MNFFAVLRSLHLMVGCDIHIPVVPPSGPPSPYYTMAPLRFIDPSSARCSDDLPTVWGSAMLKGTDIGKGILPHVGPPTSVWALQVAFSSSKSLFGTSLHKSHDEPIAVALLGLTNPNLNCGTPMPTPTGLVIAPTTHLVGMTWEDFSVGLGEMCAEMAIGLALNKLGKFAEERFVTRIVSNIKYQGLYNSMIEGQLPADLDEAIKGLRETAGDVAEKAAPYLVKPVEHAADMVVGYFKAPEKFAEWSASKSDDEAGGEHDARPDAVENHLNGQPPGGSHVDFDREGDHAGAP